MWNRSDVLSQDQWLTPTGFIWHACSTSRGIQVCTIYVWESIQQMSWPETRRYEWKSTVYSVQIYSVQSNQYDARCPLTCSSRMVGSMATTKGEFGVSNFSNIWLCDPNGKLQIFYFVFTENQISLWDHKWIKQNMTHWSQKLSRQNPSFTSNVLSWKSPFGWFSQIGSGSKDSRNGANSGIPHSRRCTGTVTGPPWVFEKAKSDGRSIAGWVSWIEGGCSDAMSVSATSYMSGGSILYSWREDDMPITADNWY